MTSEYLFWKLFHNRKGGLSLIRVSMEQLPTLFMRIWMRTWNKLKWRQESLGWFAPTCKIFRNLFFIVFNLVELYYLTVRILVAKLHSIFKWWLIVRMNCSSLIPIIFSLIYTFHRKKNGNSYKWHPVGLKSIKRLVFVIKYKWFLSSILYGFFLW